MSYHGDPSIKNGRYFETEWRRLDSNSSFGNDIFKREYDNGIVLITPNNHISKISGWRSNDVHTPQPFKLWDSNIIFVRKEKNHQKTDGYCYDVIPMIYKIKNIINILYNLTEEAWKYYQTNGYSVTNYFRYAKFDDCKTHLEYLLKAIQDEDIPELDYDASDKEPLSEDDLIEVEELIDRIEDILDRRTRKDSEDLGSTGIIFDEAWANRDEPVDSSIPNPIYNIEKDETPEEKAAKEKKRLNDAYERAMKIF